MSQPRTRSTSSSSCSSQESRASSSSLSSFPSEGSQPAGDKPSSPEPALPRPVLRRPRPPRLAVKSPAPKHSLLDFPNELLLTIGHSLTTDRDIHALSKSCRRLHALLGEDLYLLNSMFRHASALVWAARTGNVARIRKILDLERVESTATFSVWRESLHLAARRGHRQTVRLLLDEEPVALELARPDAECRLKPLTYAAGGRQTETLRYLLATLPRVNRRDAAHALLYSHFLGEEEAAALLRDALSTPAADASCVPRIEGLKKRGGRILVTGFSS